MRTLRTVLLTEMISEFEAGVLFNGLGWTLDAAPQGLKRMMLSGPTGVVVEDASMSSPLRNWRPTLNGPLEPVAVNSQEPDVSREIGVVPPPEFR